LNPFKYFALAALLLCVFGAQVGSAQPQPWTLSIVQGNGQLICNSCNAATLPGVNNTFLQQFTPLYVRVKDANGNPVPGAAVIWTVGAGGQYLNIPSNTTTTTDGTGLTSIQFTAPFQPGSTGNPIQSMVSATLATNAGVSVNFTLTQTALDNQQTRQLNLDLTCSALPQYLPPGCTGLPTAPVTGNAGSSGTPIFVGVFGNPTTLFGGLSGPIAGVSVKLVNYQSGATVTCLQGQGAAADPGSVLTDSTGYAMCTPVLAGKNGGQFVVLVGGVVLKSVNYAGNGIDYSVASPLAPPYISTPPVNDPNQVQPTYQGYVATNVFNLNVVPAVLGNITKVSGDNQSANPGSALNAPLVANLTSTTNSPIVGQAVTWTAKPFTAVVFSNTSTASDVNGNVSTNLAFTSTASGPVTITLAATGVTPAKSVTFTVNATIPVVVVSLTKVSGDSQTALENAAFANPLVVQLNVTGGSPANQPVQFSLTGPAIFTSSASTTTDANGHAQVTVQAGNTAGPVTVTATSGTFSTSFSLTVLPPGPQVTAGSFYNGADFQQGSISPCSIAAIIAPGLAPNTTGLVSSYNLVGLIGTSVGTTSVSVGGTPAPVLNVGTLNSQQQITFQVPCSVAAGSSVPVVVTQNGGSNTVNVPILPSSPGVFQTQNSVTTSLGSLPIAAIMKRDGTLVSPTNPARVNETVIAFVTGLGPTSPSVGTNSLPIFGVPSTVMGQVTVGIQNSGLPPSFAQLSEDLVGIYLVGFQIPANTPTGNDLFSIGIVPQGSTKTYYSNPTAIYIQ
jgi:uncharacterized protein (TIGR03437 family)